MEYITLTPAYGRDYETPEKVLTDWDANKDFRIKSGNNTTYINKSDFINLKEKLFPSVKYIKFRYRKEAKVKVIKVTEETLTV